MRQRPLHDALRAFDEEAAWQLAEDSEDGARRLRVCSSARPARGAPPPWPHSAPDLRADSWSDVSVLLQDRSPVPDEVPEYIERDFTGHVRDFAYVVVEELRDDRFDQSAFRALGDEGRDQAIRELLSRGFGSPTVA